MIGLNLGSITRVLFFWKMVYSGVDDYQNSNFKWVDVNGRMAV